MAHLYVCLSLLFSLEGMGQGCPGAQKVYAVKKPKISFVRNLQQAQMFTGIIYGMRWGWGLLNNNAHNKH